MKYDVVATIDYESGGEKRKRYVRCGMAMDGDKGMRIKLDSVPIGEGWSGWLSLYEQKDKDSEPRAKPAAPDNDIPW